MKTLAFIILCLHISDAGFKIAEKIPEFKKLTEKQKKIAISIMKNEFCYYGCEKTIAECLAMEKPSPTALKLAEFIVELVSKNLSSEEIKKLIMERARTVHPFRIWKIDTSHSPRKGAKDAEVEIVEFLDFECPLCAKLFPVLEKIVENYQGRVSLVIKYFPIKGRKTSLPLAKAAAAAQNQGKFWKMAGEIFLKHGKCSLEELEKIARKLHLNIERFREDMKGEDVLSQITQDKKEGIRLEVTTTPVIFINGKRYLLPLKEKYLTGVLEEEMELIGERVHNR